VVTEESVYTCDLTGEVFEDEGDVLTVPIREHGRHPFVVRERVIHLSRAELSERLPRLAVPSGYGEKGFVGIEYSGESVEVVGHCLPSSSYSGSGTYAEYEERESVVGSHFEPFFELLESGDVYLL
jgi:hypothetical protein